MSLTPVDRPPEGGEAAEDPRSRRSSPVRRYLAQFVSWVGDRLTAVRPVGRSAGTRGAGDRSADSGDQSVSRGSSRSGRADAHLEDRTRAERSVDRARALARPRRDSPESDRTEVVSTETEDGLRLSLPSNPDATLTSDVWTTVDP